MAEVKLSDFGCSKKEETRKNRERISKDSPNRSRNFRCRQDLTKSFTTIGSIPWMAPEVILHDGYGRKVLVFAVFL